MLQDFRCESRHVQALSFEKPVLRMLDVSPHGAVCISYIYIFLVTPETGTIGTDPTESVYKSGDIFDSH